MTPHQADTLASHLLAAYDRAPTDAGAAHDALVDLTAALLERPAHDVVFVMLRADGWRDRAAQIDVLAADLLKLSPTTKGLVSA